MRLLILGWDGADPALVRKLLGRGRLPNLAALISRGLFSELPSIDPDVLTRMP